MSTSAPRSQQVATGNASRQGTLGQETGARRLDRSSGPDSSDSARKPARYGLPCAKCRLYYPADLDICPTCHHHERVSPVVPSALPKIAQSVPDPIPDSSVIEQEREEFLRQFKSQLLEAHSQVANGLDSVCTLGERHAGELAPAEVCKPCYERLQERLDVCEAALHLDLKEAAQIIYDAVWADPSDPSKTYQNAASALLSELRKRTGMNSLHGPFQPLSH